MSSRDLLVLPSSTCSQNSGYRHVLPHPGFVWVLRICTQAHMLPQHALYQVSHHLSLFGFLFCFVLFCFVLFCFVLRKGFTMQFCIELMILLALFLFRILSSEPSHLALHFLTGFYEFFYLKSTLRELEV